MSEGQLETLITRIVSTVAGASPAPNDLTDDQQRVVLQYQLLRNGLLRHSLPAETTSQVLIRITQRDCRGTLELTAEDSIPPAAVSLRVAIGDGPAVAPRLRSREPGHVFAYVDRHENDPGVGLVQFIDARGHTVAAGIPAPLEKSHHDSPRVSPPAESLPIPESHGAPNSEIVVTETETQSVEVLGEPSSSESADSYPTTPNPKSGRKSRPGESRS